MSTFNNFYVPNYYRPVPMPIGYPSRPDNRTQSYINFLNVADTQGGKLQGDGKLTQDEIQSQLSAYQQQSTSLGVASSLFGSVNPLWGQTLGGVKSQIDRRIQVGERMNVFFNLFSGGKSFITESGLNQLSQQDQNPFNISNLDLILSGLAHSSQLI